MKHVGKMAIGLAGALGLHLDVRAVTADSPGNPYVGIVDRNVFALKPKPPPPPTETTPVVPPQKITPLGIINAYGKKQVLFKTLMPAKPGEGPREASFTLSEGERAGEIEVLEIDPVNKTIKFNNHGTPDLKDLEKDGLKPTGGAGAIPGLPPGSPSIPGVPGAPSVPMNNTGIPAPASSSVTTFGGGGAASVQRPLRVAPTTASGYSAARTVPAGASPQNVNAPTERSMSAEEQAVMIEVNRKLTADAVKRGDMPPLPPGIIPE